MTAASVFRVEPLLAKVWARWDGEPQVRPPQALARTAELSPSTVYQATYRQGGWLSVRQADEWAILAGFHPIEVWGDDWLDLDGEDT